MWDLSDATLWITPKEVAEQLKLSQWQATKLVKSLPGVIKVGKEYRAPQTALLKQMEILRRQQAGIPVPLGNDF
jgi:hypothetical protein